MSFSESEPASIKHRHGGEHQRHFVTDHLRDGAHRSDQRILILARPARHEDRQFRGGADGKKKQNAGVQIDGAHVAAQGQHRERQPNRNRQDERRQKVESLSAEKGTMSSLVSILRPSASGCNRPHGPTRLGPNRFCMRPSTLRSTMVVKAKHSAEKRHDARDVQNGGNKRLHRRREPSGNPVSHGNENLIEARHFAASGAACGLGATVALGAAALAAAAASALRLSSSRRASISDASVL